MPKQLNPVYYILLTNLFQKYINFTIARTSNNMNTSTQDIEFVKLVFKDNKLQVQDDIKNFKKLMMNLSLLNNPNIAWIGYDILCRCSKTSAGTFSLLLSYTSLKQCLGEFYKVLYDPCETEESQICIVQSHMDKMLMDVVLNGFTGSVYAKANKILNELSQQIQELLSSQQKIKSQIESEKQQVIQQIGTDPACTNQTTTTQNIVNSTEKTTEQGGTKIINSINELYFKELSANHFEFYIPNKLRKVVEKYGVRGNSGPKIRAIDFNSKICFIMLRKTKSKSVLRLNSKNKDKFILKIGVGNSLITNQSDKFEWRVPHTEENIQHLKTSMIELNKWYKEKKELYQKEKNDIKEKKKEGISKIIESLQHDGFGYLE